MFQLLFSQSVFSFVIAKNVDYVLSELDPEIVWERISD